jgi:glutamate racemase
MLVTCGIPQGSILGTSLFILYINDICNVSPKLKFILFADDTNVFYSGKDIKEICDVISEELEKLNIWF